MGKNDRRVTNILCASFTAMTGKGLTTRRTGPVVARRTNTKLRMRPMSPPKKRKKDGSKKESEDEHNVNPANPALGTKLCGTPIQQLMTDQSRFRVKRSQTNDRIQTIQSRTTH